MTFIDAFSHTSHPLTSWHCREYRGSDRLNLTAVKIYGQRVTGVAGRTQ